MIGNLPPRHPLLRIFARGIFFAVAVILISQILFNVARAETCSAPAVVHRLDVDNGGTGWSGSAVSTHRGVYTATHNLEHATGSLKIAGREITAARTVAPDVSLIPASIGAQAPLSRAADGTRVVVAGYPRGRYYEAQGVATQYLGLLRVKAPGFDLGISGGGVFTCTGQLVGIVTSITADRAEVIAYPVALYPYELRIDTEAARFAR
jgi:uncharacterized protein YjlB